MTGVRTPAAPTAADAKNLQLRMQAEMARRQRAGVWSAGVEPHTEYQMRPFDWIVEKLGVPAATLRWTLNEAYGAHVWDGDQDPLIKILEAIAAGKDVGVESATGTGKCQPVDEPIPTPVGWRTIGELQPGDFVFGRDGKPTEVLAVYPQGIRPIYRLTFSDGASTRACAEHLWVMQNKKDLNLGCPWRVMSTADLVAMSPRTLHNRSLRVPLPGAIAWPAVELPLAPYLLGVLLGDGGFRAQSPTVSTADQEILAALESELPVGVTVKHSSGYDYRLVGERSGGVVPNPLTEVLRGLGLFGHKSETKFIPPAYLRSSAPQRLALLQGLLDTDGSVSPIGKHIEYCSTSEVLALGVVELVRSLGGTASCRKSGSYLNGERKLDRYRVAVNMPEGVVPFRLERKAAVVREWGSRSYGLPSRILRSVEPAGDAECVCIRVAAADALYVTNDFIVTHNTFLAACITLWFLACFPDARVIHVAPKEDQLLTQVWMEIGRLWEKFHGLFPQAELLTGKLRMKSAVGEQEVWAATAFVCGVGATEEFAGKAKGFHARHMLIVSEETQQIDPAIMASLEQTRTDDHNPHLALGNPDNQRDQLHQFCMKPSTVAVRISAFDHPNVVCGQSIVPGAIGRRRLAERQADFQSPDSRGYLSQLRGISPAESYEQLIKWEWCVAAAARYHDPAFRVGDRAMGVDAANSEAGDRAAIARFQGACCTEVTAFPCPDANKLGDRVVQEARDPEGPVDPRYIGVDGVGVGAGAVNECRRQGLRVRNFQGAQRAIPGMDQDTLWSEVSTEGGKLKAAGPTVVEAERFDNQSSQIKWRAREDLRLGRLAIPDNKELFEDLCAWTYETGTGKIVVCEKDAVKKILKRSPNQGDAFFIGNFVRRRAWLPRNDAAGEVRPVTSRNRDTGLERKLTEHAKRAKKDEQRIRRIFRRRTG